MKNVEGKLRIHATCKENIWPAEQPFSLPFSVTDIEDLAKQNVNERVTVPGVQPKLSLNFDKNKQDDRITIVGALQGNYILKPPNKAYPQMPEMEALCMLLVQATDIETVPFSLIPLQSGELAYITKRIDRVNGEKRAMEDFCQLTERLTERKYSGSHEQIAKAIQQYARNPLLEVVRFYELVLACFLLGNSDMHLKNFSLIETEKGYQLAPAYDVIASRLFVPEDKEELALTLNGRKSKLKRRDFITAMKTAGLSEKASNNLLERVKEHSKKWPALIENSFLAKNYKEQLYELIKRNKAVMYE